MLFALAVVPFFLFGLFSWLCAIYANSKRKWNTHKLAQSKASITQATKSMNMKNKDKTCTTLALCMCRGTKKQSINESMLNEARKKTKKTIRTNFFSLFLCFCWKLHREYFWKCFFSRKHNDGNYFEIVLKGNGSKTLSYHTSTYLISDHIYYSLLGLFLKLRY